jgi:hypothetical protein
MNAFQILSISVLAVVFLLELVAVKRGASSRRAWALRSTILLAAAVAIADPDIVQRFAQLIGIGRGADVVLYLFVLFFIGTSFYFYTRCAQLQRQITTLVRHLALQGASQGRAGEGGGRQPNRGENG